MAKDDKTRKYDDGKDKAEISGQSFMLNGYYDIDNPTIFKPYVGAGVGMPCPRGGGLKAGEHVARLYRGSERQCRLP